MGRHARIVMTLDDFRKWAAEAETLDFDVLYSPRLNQIVLADRGIVVHVCGRGIFFTKHGYVGKSFVKIGSLL